jgi:SAM-dependent methyltransferase
VGQWDEFVDSGKVTEQERLALLEHVFDPISVRNLDRFGIQPGWRCLEVGAGAGSIARELAKRAGAENVVATDRNISLLDSTAAAGVTVLQHDVVVDPAPGTFDLIHTRYLLEHLPARETAIERMVSWLKPGGWLVVDAGSTLPELSSRPVTQRAMIAAVRVLSERIGTEPRWPRVLPGPLISAGLSSAVLKPLLLPSTAVPRWPRGFGPRCSSPMPRSWKQACSQRTSSPSPTPPTATRPTSTTPG